MQSNLNHINALLLNYLGFSQKIVIKMDHQGSIARKYQITSQPLNAIGMIFNSSVSAANESSQASQQRHQEPCQAPGLTFGSQQTFPKRRVQSKLRSPDVANRQDFVKFKRLSKSILQDLSPMLSPKLRTEQVARPFYLSNHAELVATRSTSIDHRRQDAVLTEQFAGVLNKHLCIPNKSSYDKHLQSIEDIKGRNKMALTIDQNAVTKTSTFGFGTTKRYSFAEQTRFGDLNQASSINASHQSRSPGSRKPELIKRQSAFDKRSFSINGNCTGASFNMTARICGDTAPNPFQVASQVESNLKENIKVHFLHSSPKFFMSQTGHQQFKGFRKTSDACGNKSISARSGLTQLAQVKGAQGYQGVPLPFHYNAPFLQQSPRTHSTFNGSHLFEQPLAQNNASVLGRTQNLNTHKILTTLNDKQEGGVQVFSPRDAKGSEPDSLGKSGLDHGIESRDPTIKNNHQNEQILAENQSNAKKEFKTTRRKMKTYSGGMFPKINENSEAAIGLEGEEEAADEGDSLLTPSYIEGDYQKDERAPRFPEFDNQLMFRKHNPIFKIQENINNCGLSNFREGKIQGGGGTKLPFAKAGTTVARTHQNELVVQESQKSELFKTLQRGIKDNSGNSPLRTLTWRDKSPLNQKLGMKKGMHSLVDQQALRKTQIKDQSLLEMFQRFKEKSPNDLKERFLKDLASSLKKQRENRRLLENTDFDYGLDKPESPKPSEIEEELRQLYGQKWHPHDQIFTSSAKSPNLNKNAENIRQFNGKLDRSLTKYEEMFDNTNQEFRKNMVIMNWQQKMIKQNVLPHDFVSAGKAYEESLRKAASGKGKGNQVSADRRGKGPQEGTGWKASQLRKPQEQSPSTTLSGFKDRLSPVVDIALPHAGLKMSPEMQSWGGEEDIGVGGGSSNKRVDQHDINISKINDEYDQQLNTFSGVGTLTPFDQVSAAASPLQNQAVAVIDDVCQNNGGAAAGSPSFNNYYQQNVPKTAEVQPKVEIGADEQKTADMVIPSLVSDYPIVNESVERRYRNIQKKFLKKARKMIGDIEKSDLSRKVRQKREQLIQEIKEFDQDDFSNYGSDSEKSQNYASGPPDLQHLSQSQAERAPTKTEKQLIQQILQDVKEYHDIIMSLLEGVQSDLGSSLRPDQQHRSKEALAKILEETALVHEGVVEAAGTGAREIGSIFSGSDDHNTFSMASSGVGVGGDQNQILGKLPQKFDKKLAATQMQIQQRRLCLVLKSLEANRIFEEDPLFQFLKMCYLNDIPSLNLLSGITSSSIFFIANQRLPAGVWRALADCMALFAEKKIAKVHIQNSFIDDFYFPKMLEQLMEHAEIRQLTLSQLVLGPKTIQTVARFCKGVHGLMHLSIYDCAFQNDRAASLTALLTALAKNAPNFSKLSLIMLKMTEQDLPALRLVLEMCPNLRDMDISYNQIAPPRLLLFLQQLEEINKLTHLNISWNSLGVVKRRLVEKRHVKSMGGLQATQLLCSFVKRQTRLQHLDLSSTHLSEKTVHYLIKRIAKSTTLNSVHLSGVMVAMSQRTIDFLMEKLNPLDMRQKKDLESILKEQPLEGPPLTAEDLQAFHQSHNVSATKQAQSAFNNVVDILHKPVIKQQLLTSGVGSKGDALHHCKQENQHQRATAGQKFVLQRIVGHPEIDTFDKKGENRITMAKIIQNAMNTPESQKLQDLDQEEINRRKSRWFISETCWLCSQSRYFIPLFLHSEIRATDPQKQLLTAPKELLLQKMLERNQVDLFDLEPMHPYIIGSCTEWRLVRMKKIVELLLVLDQNRVQALQESEFDEAKLQQYYKQKMFMLIERYLGCKAYFDRTLSKPVDNDDCLYAHNDFVVPGHHEYFIVVGDGQGKLLYKDHILAFVKPRVEEPEIRSIPLAEKDESEELMKPKVVIESTNPVLLGEIYEFETKEDKLKAMQDDLARWPLKSKVLRQDQMEGLNVVLKKHMLEPCMDLYRELVCYCDAFPVLNRDMLINLLLEFNIAEHREDEEIEGSGLKKSSNMGSQASFGSPRSGESGSNQGSNDASQVSRVLSVSEVDQIIIEVKVLVGKKTKQEAYDEVATTQIDRSELFMILASVGAKQDKTVRRTEPKDSIERLLLQDFKPIFDNSILLKEKKFIKIDLQRGQVNDLLFLNRENLKALYNMATNVKSEATAKRNYKPFTFKSAKELTGPIFEGEDSKLQLAFRRSKQLARRDPYLEGLAQLSGLNTHSILSYSEFVVFLGFTAADVLPLSVVLEEIEMPPKGYTGPLDVRLGILMHKMFSKRNLQMKYPQYEEAELPAQEYSEDTDYASDPETGYSASEQRRVQMQLQLTIQKSMTRRF